MALAFIPATFAVYMRCSSEELLLKSARVWQKLKKKHAGVECQYFMQASAESHSTATLL